MSKKQSAGILAFKKNKNQIKIFLVHPGGPFWRNKDESAWSIPKGEFTETEEPLSAAKREFLEETGVLISGTFIQLQPIKLKSGKTVFAWAIETDLDADKIVSNYFEIQWPPHSGKMQSFPEVDKGAWFNIEEAKQKINVMQINLLEQLEDNLKRNSNKI